jgi:hypothetical protein
MYKYITYIYGASRSTAQSNTQIMVFLPAGVAASALVVLPLRLYSSLTRSLSLSISLSLSLSIYIYIYIYVYIHIYTDIDM